MLKSIDTLAFTVGLRYGAGTREALETLTQL